MCMCVCVRARVCVRVHVCTRAAEQDHTCIAETVALGQVGHHRPPPAIQQPPLFQGKGKPPCNCEPWTQTDHTNTHTHTRTHTPHAGTPPVKREPWTQDVEWARANALEPATYKEHLQVRGAHCSIVEPTRQLSTVNSAAHRVWKVQFELRGASHHQDFVCACRVLWL